VDAQSEFEAEPVSATQFERPRLSSWLWKPWYAKLWWVSIPVYWIGMFGSRSMPLLIAFYESAFAGYLNIAFMPFTALLILGFGYAPARLDLIRNGEDPNWQIDEIFDPSSRPGKPFPFQDIYNPRSGTRYIGNPLSLQWPHRKF
jgi:hypothetical protein